MSDLEDALQGSYLAGVLATTSTPPRDSRDLGPCLLARQKT